MKVKCVGFLFLSALIISGCSTKGSVSGMQSKSMEIQPERIEQLERDMQEVKRRISALETMHSGNSKTNETVIIGNMIEGELRQRKVIYKPEPPVINLERDVTVTLKFTVLPNGEVDQIFPYRKAEPKLERLAMQLLRQYRFEPLFESDKVQQGIIHLTIYGSGEQ